MAESTSDADRASLVPEMPYDEFIVEAFRYFYHDEIASTHAYDRARLALLDSLGCAVESYTQSAQCRAMVGAVVPGTKVPNGCRLSGTRFELDPVKASFDLGSMIRYLNHNDGYTGREWGHSSDMMSAILSVADWESRSSVKKPDDADLVRDARPRRSASSPITMKELLTATIKAYEVHCLFQHTNSFNARGLDHIILVKALAALSQAYQDGGPLRTYRQAPNTGPRKGWAAGDACMRATHLALLTAYGRPGAPTVLSDRRWGFFAPLSDGESFKLPSSYATYGVENSAFK